MWAAINQNHLTYLCNNQGLFCATLRNGLDDALHNDSINLHNIGKQTVLPSSYTGGPRHMYQQYLDAMAIA